MIDTDRFRWAGSGATRFPASSLLLRSSAARLRRPRLWFPSSCRPTCAQVLVRVPKVGAPACLPWVRSLVTRSPLSRDITQERWGPPWLLGRPLRTRYWHTPRRMLHPLALARASLSPSGVDTPWASGNRQFRGWPQRLARSRTYASPPASRQEAQGSLPVGWL